MRGAEARRELGKGSGRTSDLLCSSDWGERGVEFLETAVATLWSKCRGLAEAVAAGRGGEVVPAGRIGGRHFASAVWRTRLPYGYRYQVRPRTNYKLLQTR